MRTQRMLKMTPVELKKYVEELLDISLKGLTQDEIEEYVHHMLGDKVWIARTGHKDIFWVLGESLIVERYYRKRIIVIE